MATYLDFPELGTDYVLALKHPLGLRDDELKEIRILADMFEEDLPNRGNEETETPFDRHLVRVKQENPRVGYAFDVYSKSWGLYDTLGHIIWSNTVDAVSEYFKHTA